MLPLGSEDLNYKERKMLPTGQTRSGRIYNLERGDVALTKEEGRQWKSGDAEALTVWETLCGDNGINRGDAFTEAKTLCNLAYKWHKVLNKTDLVRRVLWTFTDKIKTDVESGDAFFFRARTEFVDRYTTNLCDIIQGSLETGDWSWTNEAELVYW